MVLIKLQAIIFFISAINCADIKLCEDKNVKGECITVSLSSSKKCVNLDKKNWASSISMKYYCFRLYEKENCEGKSLYVSSRSPGHNDLEVIGMNKMISSIGKCFSADLCTKPKRARNNGNCPFVIDYLTIGFLSSLPKDNKNVNPPVVYYQISAPNNRTEVMEAVIENKHLNTGTDINPDTRRYAQEIIGTRNDAVGYVLPKRLGGSGTDRRNIFPQTKDANEVILKEVEDKVINVIKLYGKARYTMNLHYNSHLETRPDFLVYRILGGDDNKFIDQGDIPNQREKTRRSNFH